MYHPLTNSKFRYYQAHSPDETKLVGLVREGCHFARSFACSIEVHPELMYVYAMSSDTVLFQVAKADPNHANHDDFRDGIEQGDGVYEERGGKITATIVPPKPISSPSQLITPFQSLALPSSIPADGSKVYRVRPLCYALIHDNCNKISRA